MSSSRTRRWHLIRESIKFQIKLTLDAVRDLLLSPVAIICTVLDLIKGNSKQQGYFQRLMQWGHNTDHWLNLFGDLPVNASSQTNGHVNKPAKDNQAETQGTLDENLVLDSFKAQKAGVDSNLDKLFSKIELILEEQQREGAITAKAKQKIAHYLAVLNSNSQHISAQKNSVNEPPGPVTDKAPNDEG